MSIISLVQSFLVVSAVLSILSLAAYKAIVGSITVGDFVLINIFIIRTFMPLSRLAGYYRNIRKSLIEVENIFSLFSRSITVNDNSVRKLESDVIKSVSFKDVSFSYENGKSILHDINFSVKSGEKLAVLGSSGSGKSTIAKLLLRLYDPDSGYITINNQKISDLHLSELRRVVAIVPQDVVLFNDTLYNNICYGSKNVSESAFEKAILASNLKDLINTLEDGVDTVVGERGIKLSGGEKQRIAIARVLLRGAKIVIFDEFTAALDSESEQAMLNSVKNAFNDCITIFIAHKLSTILDSDKILYIDKGTISEAGSHFDLIKNAEGNYSQMWKLYKTKSVDFISSA
jgi:ATP-binding cassette subfamily B protein